MLRNKTTCLRILGPLVFLGALLTRSVDGGVPDKPWPFYRPEPPKLPSVRRSAWLRNPIDAFILQKLESEGLAPAPEASRRALVRRLYFDVLGLPPTPEEVNAFVEDDHPQAYERLVDRLLGDTRYGERWARFWLDLARYADTAGYEGDPDLPHAWRYRDYVIDALNNDKPYDLFIREQIAGDEFDEIMGAGDLPETPPERVVALTFLRLAPFTEPRGDETRHELLSEMTSTVGSVFLGLTVGCAKCHDHKHDEIPTDDFYRLQAFFATVQIPRPEPGDAYQIGGPLPAAFYRPGEEQWAARTRDRLRRQAASAPVELAALKDQIADRISRVARPRIDDAAVVDKQDGQRIESAAVEALVRNDSPLITPEEKRRYQFLSTRERFVDQHLKRLEPVAMSLRHSYGPPYEPGVPTSRVRVRGEYDNPGVVVQPGFLSVITGDQRPASIRLDPFKRWPTRSRRMALADWIASDDNPLTHRVLVNRLWHWHFGQGIVQTPSDFGYLSDGPSHPELLDWLALRFVAEKWSIKSIQRLILQSSAYRQSSRHANAEAERQDPDNRWLWRFNRRRLDAEAIRDSVLAVSGRLHPEQFGLPIFPPLPSDVAETVKYSVSKWDTQDGPQSRKRSIYIYQQRTLTMPFLQTFDALVCDESRPRRRASISALQALAMYNGDFVNTEARHFARQTRLTAGDDVAARILFAFERALGRSPNDDELSRMRRLVQSYDDEEDGLVGLCRVLFNANEFIYVD